VVYVTIHTSDPFATPEHERSPVRRLRGRLPAAVTLWTAVAADGTPTGLTVSSTLVVDGQPGRVAGLLDEESALWAAIEATGRFAVAPLGAGDRQLADKFAGLMPAPGGPFHGYDWQASDFGPVLVGVSAWAGCRLDSARPFGWGLLIDGTIDIVDLAAEQASTPLIHFRGRYRGLA
jgi:flavin reductase (DIM6/NTAB) family NADH-FMN oxidoreductase RutF